MTGTYIGTYHGGNDFTGESGMEVTPKLQRQADINWVNANYEASASSRGSGPGLSSAASAAGRTGGPGASGVGAVSGSGPGNDGAVARGGLSIGPGMSAKATASGKISAGLFMSKPLPVNTKNPDTVTNYTYMGLNIKAAPWISDANRLENRSGDSEFWTMVDGTLIRGSDFAYTGYLAMKDNHATVDPLKLLPQVPEGKHIYDADPMRSDAPASMPTNPSQGGGW